MDERKWAVGGAIGSNIIICGGLRIANFFGCSTVGLDSIDVTQIHGIHNRTSAAGAVFGNSLFITGGLLEPSYSKTKSTEYVYPDGNVESMAGVDLPRDISFHCMVKINSSTAVLIGGSLMLYRTYFYTETSQGANWTQGPDMNYFRGRGHVCGVIKDSTIEDYQMVVTVGES